MRVKLSETQYKYLHVHIHENLKRSMNLFRETDPNTDLSLDIHNDIVNEIRDWAMKKQVELGFDTNYKLTSEGMLLEELIDLFFE
jgi:hypothetical protein